MSDCIKCWDTPCTCGWDYRNYKVDKFSLFISDIVRDKTEEEQIIILEAALEKVKERIKLKGLKPIKNGV